MKLLNHLQGIIAVLMVGFFTLMSIPPPISACEECNKRFLENLKKRAQTSLQAEEMLRVIERNDPGVLNTQSPLPINAAPYVILTPQGKAESPRKVSGTPSSSSSPRRLAAKTEKKPTGETQEPSSSGLKALPDTSFVPADTPAQKQVEITMEQGIAYLGKGVIYRGFTIGGQIPGPTVILEEGDVVEWVVHNKGSVPHGMSIHAAYTQTSKYLGNIGPGETKRIKFRVTYPGVYLYHCAPGGHAIPMHTFFGQYGMIVVKPKTKKFRLEVELGRKPDLELYLIQHEFYASGKDAIEGKPLYITFNGQLFRYVENPIVARPGDYVRIYFLNVGPNIISTFHLVGIIWDYAYWQGHPDNVFVGGQSVLAGPTDSWVVEFRVPPDEGNYLIVTHAFGSATRGAIGILKADRKGNRTPIVLADGPKYSAEELKELEKKAIRTLSVFEPGTPDVDPPYIARGDEGEVSVRIIGNTYYPKVLRIRKGTTVEWINEDVFTYAGGEFAGIHNVLAYEAPEPFSSPLLAHAERWQYTFTKPGTYKVMCTPHPYMRGVIIVEDRNLEPQLRY